MQYFLKRFPIKQGKLLDIGCGHGLFLERAKNVGFEVWGTDFDEKSIKCAKKRGLENVYNFSSEDFVNFAKEKKLKFDVIVFNAVLEHLDRPKIFIDNIK